MRVSVLMVDGVFDSGLATVCDVLAAANALRAEIPQPPPGWEVTVVGARRHMHTGAGHRVETEPLDVSDPGTSWWCRPSDCTAQRIWWLPPGPWNCVRRWRR